ncbi:MAG: hypothetical protein Q9208_003142 [Pyrenodesmia sp. 3 TL-2023]
MPPVVTGIASGLDSMLISASLTLDRLPVEIQRNIYANLLTAEEVRQPPDRCMIHSYAFQTAILRANKRIHDIAYPMLYGENHFAVVSGNWSGVLESLKHHAVAIITSTPNIVARFTKHVLRLHISYPYTDCHHGAAKPNDVRESFIILHRELPHFVRLLQVLDMRLTGGTSAYKLKFRIEGKGAGAAGLRVQKSVLEPFRQLTSGYQTVKILGDIDAAYAQGLLHDMMFPIQWTRAVEWRLYSHAVSVFNAAEDALRHGNTEEALVKYVRSQDLWGYACDHNPRLGRAHDSDINDFIYFVITACQANIVLLGLKDSSRSGKEWLDWLQAQAGWIDAIQEPILRPQATLMARSRTHHYRGIVHALSGDDVNALNQFAEADRLIPENTILKSHIAITQKRLAAPSATEKHVVGSVHPDQLPLEPITMRDQKFPHNPSYLIATERCIMRNLNYPGDLLLHIPEMKPVSATMADQITETLKKTKQDTHGTTCPSWFSHTYVDGMLMLTLED